MEQTSASLLDPELRQMFATIDDKGRQTPEYAMGWTEAIDSMRQGSHSEAFEKIVEYAEKYYQSVKGKLALTDFRIGCDPATNLPAILQIVEGLNADSMSDLMDAARDIELFVWENMRVSFHIWTLPAETIDRERVEKDFPISRALG